MTTVDIKDIFLGGTCNESTWRDFFIKCLEEFECPFSWFNPVVSDWTPACQAIEEEQKKNCKIHVYCITPKMTGVFSIAEMTEAAITRPDSTYIIILATDGSNSWTEGQARSLRACIELANRYGAHTYTNLKDCAKAICRRAIPNEY